MNDWGKTIPKLGMPDFALSACAAITYVTDPAIWPQFVDYMEANHPGAARSEIREQRELVARHAGQLLHALGYGAVN